MLLLSELELGNYAGRKGVAVKKLDKEALEKELRGIKGKIGLNFDSLTANQARRLKLLTKARQADVSGYFEKLREIKTQREIKKIKTACRISLETLDRLEEFAKRCKTERQLALRLEFESLNSGAERIAFPTIVASGKGSAIPHYATANRKISAGFLVVDFGVVYEGYCSDITRTLFVGKPTAYHKHMFATVLNAKEAAMKECFSGNSASKVHAAAEAVIEKGFNEKMIHSVGHGLGMRVHDFPRGINSESKIKLKENMCITVEPGHYENGFGGVRIEDDVVIKKGKCKELTKAERELVSLNL